MLKRPDHARVAHLASAVALVSILQVRPRYTQDVMLLVTLPTEHLNPQKSGQP